MAIAATDKKLEAVLHKPNWADPSYAAYRLRLVVDELRRFPTLEELEELGRFRNPNITGGSGFADLAAAIGNQGYDLHALYQSFGGEGYLATKEVDFPSPHQLAAAVMLGEKKRMLVHDDFRTGKTAIGIIAKPYLESNVLNQMTAEQKKAWQEIDSMPWSEERQRLEQMLYSDVAKVKATTLAVVPGPVMASWRQKVDGYLGIQQTVATIYSDAIVVERTRTGEQTVLRGNRLADLKTALSQNPDYAIVSYDMVFRTTADMSDPATQEAVQTRYEQYKGQILDRRVAEERIAEVLGRKRATAAARRSPDLDTLLQNLAQAEVRQESEHVFELLRDYGFKLLVLDEVDNARNAKALRTKAVNELAAAAEYFLPMSGYPAPNKVVRDLAQLAAMIDPEHYDHERYPETAVPFGVAYANHPELVRDFVLLHSKPQTKASDLGIKVPEVVESDVAIDLEGVHREVYEAIRRYRNMDISQKMWLLRFALVDPTRAHPEYDLGSQSMKDKLSEVFSDNPQLLARLEREREAPTPTASSVYQALDGKVLEAVMRGDKFVIFTTLKEGVTNELRQRYEAMGLGMWKIDGDIDSGSDEYLSDREKIRLDFQTNPEKQGMIINLTMRQGICLDAANVLVTIDRAFDPGTDRQVPARLQGRYQGKKVYVHHLTPRNTIARGIESMLLDKELLINLVFHGHELTPEQRRRLEERNFMKHQDIVESINPKDLLNSYFRRMHGRGYISNLDFISADKELVAQRFAESYDYDWEHSYSAQTNRLILKVLEMLSRSGHLTLGEMLDAPSGNFALARTILGESKLQFGRIVNIDFNRYQLELGEKAAVRLRERLAARGAKRKPLDLESTVGLMHDLSFASDRRFDLTVCSLGLQYSAQKVSLGEIVKDEVVRREFREREQIIRELVRVTKDNGYMILTLPPSSADAEGMARFSNAMRSLGVEVVSELNGIVRATRPANSTYETYLWVGRKQNFRPEAHLQEDAFVLNASAAYSHPGGRNGKSAKPAASPFSEEVCTEFELKREQKPVEALAVDYLRRIGYRRPVMSEKDFDRLRHNINVHTSELGTALKAQILEVFETIEAEPERLPGQRNRLQQLIGEARRRHFPETIGKSLNELIETLGSV